MNWERKLGKARDTDVVFIMTQIGGNAIINQFLFFTEGVFKNVQVIVIIKSHLYFVLDPLMTVEGS